MPTAWKPWRWNRAPATSSRRSRADEGFFIAVDTIQICLYIVDRDGLVCILIQETTRIIRSRLPFAVLGLAAGLLGSGSVRECRGDPSSVVHRYAAGEEASSSNAYLVELPAGVVAVDSTLTVSDSKARCGRS